MKRDEQNIIDVNRKKRLFQKLKNKEYRDALVEENINIGIPSQVKAMREQRQLNQTDIAEMSGMPQSQIARYENLEYSGFSLKTLKRIASTFDVGLIVKFVPISKIVEWEINIGSESFNVHGYENDPYFKTKETPKDTISNVTKYTNVCASDATSEMIQLEEPEPREMISIKIEETGELLQMVGAMTLANQIGIGE